MLPDSLKNMNRRTHAAPPRRDTRATNGSEDLSLDEA
jgi:hypothetical protein